MKRIYNKLLDQIDPFIENPKHVIINPEINYKLFMLLVELSGFIWKPKIRGQEFTLGQQVECTNNHSNVQVHDPRGYDWIIYK